MGTGYRVFLLDHNDQIEQIPRAQYERLLRREPSTQLLKFAGKRVRCAFVVLDVEGHIPLSIQDISYSWLSLDADGRVDLRKREKQMRLAMQTIQPLMEQDKEATLIDARCQFAKKQYEHEFKWMPTQDIQAAIVAAIFGKDPA